MKVLWLCNIHLPEISSNIQIQAAPSGGWIEGLFYELENVNGIELHYASIKYGSDVMQTVKLRNCNHYVIPAKKKDSQKYSKTLEAKLRTLVSTINPDIVHIFGTEYPHSLAMVNACKNEQKIVINIQGLVSVIANHYMSGLPANVQSRFAFRDYLKNRNILYQVSSLRKRGEYEILALKKTKHVIGRTTWDMACVQQINQNIHYYHCNEILRNEFYNSCWNINDIERFSIFVSQGSYPVKGLHLLLQSLPLILARFPKLKVYIAGSDITKKNNLVNRIKSTSYGNYLNELIESYKLDEVVEFLGVLNEKEMCNRFINSHLFISPSIIENESNSVSEAKILGVPIVASYVGGVVDRVTHDISGLVYQHDSINMLAYNVCRIFEDDNLAQRLSQNARIEALVTHDKRFILNEIIKIYEIVNKM